MSCIIFLYEKLKNHSMQSFKERMFFFFCVFCFLFLSNNILHIMFYTYICYCNTFQFKYNIEITFHVNINTFSFQYKYIMQINFHVKKTKQKLRFSVIFIYPCMDEFSHGPFTKIDNLIKMCNLDYSYRNS